MARWTTPRSWPAGTRPAQSRSKCLPVSEAGRWSLGRRRHAPPEQSSAACTVRRRWWRPLEPFNGWKSRLRKSPSARVDGWHSPQPPFSAMEVCSTSLPLPAGARARGRRGGRQWAPGWPSPGGRRGRLRGSAPASAGPSRALQSQSFRSLWRSKSGPQRFCSMPGPRPACTPPRSGQRATRWM